MGHAVSSKAETRDAILWDVLPAQRLCRVKIQGSAELIIAAYPENWEATPWWLKPGNAVRITHPGGQRGRIEIFGPGATIPTPVSGSTFPVIATGEDAVLTGCHVSQCDIPRMAVLVHVGTFRIGGTTYYLNEIAMNSDVYTMGDGGAMGDIAGALAIDAAPGAGLFRYDLISVGTDSVIDYTAGSASASPAKPSPASSHVPLVGGYLLVAGGDTAVTQDKIGRVWDAPQPYYLTMTIADSQLSWSEPFTDLTLKVYDQYNHALNPGGVYQFTLEIISGNGQVWSADEGFSAPLAHKQSATYEGAFRYYRGQDPGDRSPTLKGTVILEKDLMAYGLMLLYDSDGKLMIET